MTSTVRDRLFGGSLLVAIVALFLGGGIALKGPDRWLTYQKGPEPRTSELGSEPCGPVENGCATYRRSWVVTGEMTTVFRLDGLFGSWLRWDGTLDGMLHADFHGTCPGATVRWSIHADTRTVASGALSTVPGERATVHEPTIPGAATTVTLTAAWDRRPPGCDSFTLNWDDPEVNTGLL
ncbi:hypothetical protein [Actinomadura kijaniata]|uniref:hypothetical protein n=1 Tax=Actinomadura kijaniata TaxID=46161 RepID=UPI001C3F39F0|nr:hypothetical protein [Actinomadura kijaniata]